MKNRITGVVFYEGCSMIDGSPIVGIATFGTKNRKTGKMVQTWIMRSDVHPMDAVNEGSDSSVCGDCPLRGRIADVSERTFKGENKGLTVNKGRCCYVLVQNAPSNIWKGYKRGIYPKLSKANAVKMLGYGLRYGSYGDPVAIPVESWDKLAVHCGGKRAGYTHQWKDDRFSHWSNRVMASTHTVGENLEAKGKGFRTFRTVVGMMERSGDEIVCPASVEAGFSKSCEECGACNGSREGDKRKSVMIVSHGSGGKIGLVEKVITNRIALPLAA